MEKERKIYAKGKIFIIDFNLLFTGRMLR